MTANNHFLNSKPQYKKFYTQYMSTLLKIDKHYDLLADRLLNNYTIELYDRLDQLYMTRNSVIGKVRNIDKEFDLYCVQLLKV